MHIGYMVAAYPTLSETFIIREIKSLVSSGNEVSVFSIKYPSADKKEKVLSESFLPKSILRARPDNIVQHLILNIKSMLLHPVRYFSTLKIFIRRFPELEPRTYIKTLYHFWCGIGFSNQMRKMGIELIHAHFTAGSTTALAASLYSGIPYSFTAHASGDIFVKPVMLEQKIRYASFIVPVCEYGRKYLDSVTGYRYSGKLFCIHNGIDASETAASKSEHKKSDRNIFKIISVGRLIGCKGFGTLVDACSILVERGHAIECRLIGDGEERGMLTERIRLKKLEEVFAIEGSKSLEEVYEELSGADVFVLLSEIHVNGYRDGFPTVLLEAMLMSLPIVSTWISAIPEMVEDGTTGYIIHERDAEAAANAIEKLIFDPEKCRKFGEEGRKKVIEKFDIGKSATKLAELFVQHSVKE